MSSNKRSAAQIVHDLRRVQSDDDCPDCFHGFLAEAADEIERLQAESDDYRMTMGNLATALRESSERHTLSVRTLEARLQAVTEHALTIDSARPKVMQMPPGFVVETKPGNDGPGEEDGPWAEGWRERFGLAPFSCPHGFDLRDNICGPCSEGRATSVTSAAMALLTAKDLAWIAKRDALLTGSVVTSKLLSAAQERLAWQRFWKLCGQLG